MKVRDGTGKNAAIEVSLSEASETSGNLLRFNLPIISPSRLPVHHTTFTAYTLWDCGGSHKFVHPDLIAKLRAAGGIIKTRNRGSMELTTAGRRECMPLREARLSLDIGGFTYRGWFVLYTLAKYDIILGKSWMEEVPHHVDLNRNILWLGQDLPDCKFKYRLAGLPRGVGRQECQALAYSIDNSAKTTTTSRQLPEIAEFMVAEITDEATYQQDCARTWQRVFGKDVPIGAELLATDVDKVPEFERKIRAQYADVFQEPTGLPPMRRDSGFRIRTIPGAEPPHWSPYRMTPDEWEVYREKVQTLLSKRLIRKSSSPYAAPVILVPQGLDDSGKPKIRMVIDYRALNKITVKDRFPLPHPEDLIAKLHGMKCFTKLDFWAGFHQHRCHPETIKKTAFIDPDVLYEWLVMPFGAANAPSKFMRLMADLLFDHIDKGYCIVFIDDILVFSRTAEEHKHHVQAVMDTIRKAGFRLHGSKCSFGRFAAPFLGFDIDEEDSQGASVRMTHKKIKSISDWPYPTTPKEMRSFMGLSGVYRKFVPDFAKIAAPLSELISVEQH